MLLFRGSPTKLTFPEDARLHPASTAARAAPAPTPAPLAGAAASTSPTGYHAGAAQGTDYLRYQMPLFNPPTLPPSGASESKF